MRSLVILFLAASCTWPLAAAEPSASSAADVEFFEKKVRPLLVERCFRCHSLEAKKTKGGLLLDSRVAILKGGDSGPAVIPGDVDGSLVVQGVRYQKEHLQMPPSGRLPATEVAALEEWVRHGAVFPGPAATASARPLLDLAAARRFWSFQPARVAAALPAVRDRSWPRQPIDTFLLAALEKQGLHPSPMAPRRVLVRRAYFDLIGLPPSPEAIQAFDVNPAPDAYERLVDRLLAAPQYGERWGRFWLDLARYCDVAEDFYTRKGQSWTYRDWVVKAFNDDLPYDQFVQKQLAADLMPGVDPKDRAALGFIGLSPQYWKELKLDKDVIKTVVAEEWEERIQAVSGTFLGLTVACARCHDHKFDPISTRDYYALAGVFASVRQADRPLVSDAAAAVIVEAQGRVKALQDEIVKLEAAKPAPSDRMQKIAALRAQIEKIKKATPHYDVPMVPGVDEASLLVLADGPHKTKLEYKVGMAQDVPMQVRGNPAAPGPVVPRRFLAVLSPGEPKPFSQGSGRLELARAMVTDAAGLTARVLVNRVWKHHFGAGLVETPSDFGVQGDRPSHPELLDDLAARFIASGWSIKWLHREIMLSAAYRQASAGQAAAGNTQVVDPGNRLLWRMSRRRLEVEAWRDAMLAVTGTLTLESGGRPHDLGDPQNHRRTIYGTVKRRELNDLLRLHDVPDATTHSPSRVPTTTPLQQLFVLNSPFMQQQAAALARRLRTEMPRGVEPRVRRAYVLLYGREATASQLARAVAFLTGGKPNAIVSDAAWNQYCQVLLGSNEFLFVD